MIQAGRVLRLAVVLLAVGVAFRSVAGQQQGVAPHPHVIGTIPEVGVPLPEFSWKTLADEPFGPQRLQGKRTVLVLWSPDCPGSRAITDSLAHLAAAVSAAGGQLFVVSIDTVRAEVKEALGDAVPPSQIVLAYRGSEVLTNAKALEEIRKKIKGPIQKAVMIPTAVVIDEKGVVRSSELWKGPEVVLAKLKALQ